MLKRIYEELVAIRKELQAIRRGKEFNISTNYEPKTKVVKQNGVIKRVPIV